MAKRKMKQLALAVSTVLGSMSLMPSAQAVHLASDGLGQVLIFPYYTTRANWITLFNITNTSDLVVAAKVRFHEAYNSRDVQDFTIILSPRDVWTAWVANGPDNIPRLYTNDNSCTVPTIPADGKTFANGTVAYNAPYADGGPTGTDRLREGYVKVLMNGASTPTGLAANAVHVNGVPANCGALTSLFSTPSRIAELRSAFPLYNEAINPLKGSFNLVNGPEGLTAGGEATALADFWRTENVPPPNTGVNMIVTFQLPPQQTLDPVTSFQEPNLDSANTVGTVLTSSGVQIDSGGDTPPVGANATLFALRRASVVNQWTRKTDAASSWVTESDWVVTFPTKRYYVDNYPEQEYAGRWQARNLVAAQVGAESLPVSFPNPNFANTFSGTSCDRVVYQIFDREERELRRESGPIFSPAPPVQENSLCYEANVLTFNGSNVLGSVSPIVSNIPELPGVNGWMELGFVAAPKPTVGFSITNRITNDGMLNEAFLVNHAYKR